MKTFKLSLFSLLAMLAFSILLTSCEKKEIPEDTTQIEGKEELEQLEVKIEKEAIHQKKISIRDEATGLTAQLSISTNVLQLLDFYTGDNIQLKMGEALDEDNQNGIATETDNSDYIPISVSANIVEIKLLNVFSSTENVEDIPAISFKFEDKLRQALKEYNAGTLLKFEGDNVSRGWHNTWGRSIKMRSDGSSDGKRAHVSVFARANNGTELGSRSGSLYWCLTSRITNWGGSCYSGRLYGVYYSNDVVSVSKYTNCNASC